MDELHTWNNQRIRTHLEQMNEVERSELEARQNAWLQEQNMKTNEHAPLTERQLNQIRIFVVIDDDLKEEDEIDD